MTILVLWLGSKRELDSDLLKQIRTVQLAWKSEFRHMRSKRSGENNSDTPSWMQTRYSPLIRSCGRYKSCRWQSTTKYLKAIRPVYGNSTFVFGRCWVRIRKGHRLSLVRCFVVSLSSSRQIQLYYSYSRGLRLLPSKSFPIHHSSVYSVAEGWANYCPQSCYVNLVIILWRDAWKPQSPHLWAELRVAVSYVKDTELVQFPR
jgi:hypothetical protein